METTIEPALLQQEISALEQSIKQQKKQLAQLRRQAKAEPVQNYTFKNRNGTSITLLDLFAGRDELILIHNMGRSCQYCTLWADGLNGLTAHLSNRAAFVLVSPDEPAVQHKFALSRGWIFPMYSHAGASFSQDMGFLVEGSQMPGVSIFTKDDDGNIYRNAYTYFGPGDNYNVMWDLMDLMPSGWNNWAPQYTY